ncbi:MAG: BamA/TamA family outer membrane protein [Bacteroidota bacterium]
MRLFLTCLVCFLLTRIASANPLPPDSTQSDSGATSFRTTSLFGLPVTYFTPETRWAFGAAGLWAFRWAGDSDSARSSQLQGGAVYTLERQLLTYLSYILFPKQEKYWVYGELGYYRYTYFFHGIGNENTNPNGEFYEVNFPRLRVHALGRLSPGWYLGGHYWLEVFDIQSVISGGRLANPNLDITGRSGGVISGVGLISIYDQRDDLNFPRRGYYLEGLCQVNAPWTGSSFRYLRSSLDARGYLSLGKTVLAAQVYGDFIQGDAPFNALALLGGSRRLRGFYEGRYRADNLVGGQVEYRVPLFWRLGVNVFAGMGAVFNQWSEWSPQILRSSYGAGLRIGISKEDQINLRIDVGVAEGSLAYYLTVGEAF